MWGFYVLEFVVKRISLAPEFVATEILERLRPINYYSISDFFLATNSSLTA